MMAPVADGAKQSFGSDVCHTNAANVGRICLCTLSHQWYQIPTGHLSVTKRAKLGG